MSSKFDLLLPSSNVIVRGVDYKGVPINMGIKRRRKNRFLLLIKVLMQGQLIAVAYTLRIYLNQFYLGGLCKQE